MIALTLFRVARDILFETRGQQRRIGRGTVLTIGIDYDSHAVKWIDTEIRMRVSDRRVTL